MATITIIGNKPLGPNGENEQHPEVIATDWSCIDSEYFAYIDKFGQCSSVMITIVPDQSEGP